MRELRWSEAFSGGYCPRRLERHRPLITPCLISSEEGDMREATWRSSIAYTTRSQVTFGKILVYQQMVGPKRRTSLVFAVLMLSTTRSFIASAFSNVQNAGFLGRGGGQIPGRVFRTAEQRRGLVRTPSRAPPTKELLVTSPDEDTTVSTYNMEDIVNVCKRRGFVFQSSEIYNGFNGFYDYGPLGVELKNNIKQRWWRDMVHSRDDMVGLDSSIIASPRVWEASGHVAGFVDPMVDCRVSKLRYRADQLYFTKVELQEDGEVIGYIALLDSGDLHGEARKLAEKLKKKAGKEGTIKFPLDIKDMTKATVAEMALIPSPATGEPGSLTPPRAFNLMFQTSVGALADASSTAFLRPETAQGIFTNFKNVQSTGRVKVPFGIAQIGKAFRNEITPRNFIFRSREFEQMEIEYFIPPEEEVWPDFYNKWIETAWQWLTSIGMREDLMGRDVHLKGDLAHYAKACTDIVFRFPFGQVELQGIAARGDYDLTQHQTSSGKSMEYFDEANKRRYVPHVIEPSIGVDRLFLALICSAYAEDEIEGEKRVVLKFHPSMAPIKVGVFPLVKNKPEIMEKARAIYDQLKRRYNVFWDVSGAIGRRYRRMDEAGTPFCITVDFDTLEDDSVTVRERDSTRQTRMKVDDLLAFFDKEING